MTVRREKMPRSGSSFHMMIMNLRLWVLVLVAVGLYSSATLFFRATQQVLETTSITIKSTEDSNTKKRCFTDACIERQAALLARTWKPHGRAKWCIPDNNTHDDHSQSENNHNTTISTTKTLASTGLQLIKVPKSASSTMAGIVLRIQELYNCTVQWQHAKAVEVFENDTIGRRNETFRIAPIRHPHGRTLSSVYYHQVSLQAGRSISSISNSTPSDAYILRQLDRTENDYISDYTRPPGGNSTIKNSAQMIVRDILDAYDFLLVVEEVDASLVVWAWLADLHISDVLPISSKTTGSWYATGRGRCVALQPPVVTAAVREYWQKSSRAGRHYTDRLLHAAARLSLHETIQHVMGPDLFAEKLQEFQQWQAVILRACPNLNESAPCSPTGVYQPHVSKEACYTRDFGCGYQCVNQVVSKVKELVGS